MVKKRNRRIEKSRLENTKQEIAVLEENPWMQFKTLPKSLGIAALHLETNKLKGRLASVTAVVA